jgi:hypothetical protein
VSSRTPALSDLEQEVLAFERQWFKAAGSKEAAIRDRFGWSSTRHHQVVVQLLHHPAALAHDPVTVNRLRRLVELRTARDRG